MNESQAVVYVRAAAAILALPLDDARVQRVAEHLMRTAQMAQLLEAAPMAPEVELAEIYSPAAFQPLPDKRNTL